MPEIHPVDPHDETALRAWHDVMRAGSAVGRSAPLVSAYEELAESLRNPGDENRRLPFAAYSARAVVGTLLLQLPLKDNLHLALLDINVAPDRQGKGIGSALLQHAEAVGSAAGRTTYVSEVHVPLGHEPADWRGSRFALASGFVSQHVEDHLVLELPVDKHWLAEQVGSSSHDHPTYRFISWSGACPEEHLDGYVAMKNAMAQAVPLGDLDYEPPVWDATRVRTGEARLDAQGFTELTTVAIDQDDSLAGYTLLFVPAYRPEDALQDDTLVLAAHTGHRLSAGLKARNIQTLMHDFPERRRIHTWTAESNGPMQWINRAFGFRAVEKTHEFQKIRGD